MATYSRNTTIKNTSLPRGSYTFPTNSNTDLLIVPSYTTYKLNALHFNGSLQGTTVILRFKDLAGNYFELTGDLKAPAANQNNDNVNGTTNTRATTLLSTSPNAHASIIFNPPLELTEGQGLNFQVTGAGGARNWAATGSATINTP